MMELIAYIRHRRLMNDAPIFRIHDCEEVGRGNSGSLVQAREVEKFLSGRPQRLFRCRVERGGAAVVGGVIVCHRTLLCSRASLSEWSTRSRPVKSKEGRG